MACFEFNQTIKKNWKKNLKLSVSITEKNQIFFENLYTSPSYK